MQKSEITIISILIKRKKEYVAATKKQNIFKLKLDWDKIKTKIKTEISILYYNIIRENFLITTNLSLLYFNFANTY